MPSDDDAQEMPAWLPVFRVGDRVRVRLSSECGYCTEDVEYGLDGATGRIFDVETDQPRHHSYWVDLDNPVMGFGPLSHYCAQELEPLTSESPSRDGE